MANLFLVASSVKHKVALCSSYTMTACHPTTFRPGYGLWDWREIGPKPQNVLSRVAQLIKAGEVGKANHSLDIIITDNQTRPRQWSKTYEDILRKLMELRTQAIYYGQGSAS